ncbi:MAG: hypothetical protein ABL857_09215 [Rickettsiales bacterium]
MRKLISIFIVFALVVTTSFPSVSHAMMPHESAKTEMSRANEHSDCDGHKELKQSQKTVQTEKGKSSKCCDEGVCKCVGGTCHNTISKALNNSELLATNSSSSINAFSLSNDYVKSSFSSRLKRPPKA